MADEYEHAKPIAAACLAAKGLAPIVALLKLPSEPSLCCARLVCLELEAWSFHQNSKRQQAGRQGMDIITKCIAMPPDASPSPMPLRGAA